MGHRARGLFLVAKNSLSRLASCLMFNLTVCHHFDGLNSTNLEVQRVRRMQIAWTAPYLPVYSVPQTPFPRARLCFRHLQLGSGGHQAWRPAPLQAPQPRPCQLPTSHRRPAQSLASADCRVLRADVRPFRSEARAPMQVARKSRGKPVAPAFLEQSLGQQAFLALPSARLGP